MTALAQEVHGFDRARLLLEVHPTAAAAVAAALDRAAIGPWGRSGVRSLMEAVSPSVAGLTGGLRVALDSSLKPGEWRLNVDGEPIASGTVKCP